ncbi:MAG: CBS domain-containing protein [Thaumarchaeota archaeon]|nr:CBS domain-containing protein [Nitrososphaerota archaeon]
MPKWKCYRCGEVYDEEVPPEICSRCNARVSFWIDWTDANTPLDEPVSKFMTQELLMIDINSSAWDAARLMREKKTGSIFVSQAGHPVGIVTERDMLYKIVAEDLPAAHIMLRKIMSSPLISVSEDTPVKKALELMQDKGFRRLLITKEGVAVGMVNQNDLVLTEELKVASG